MQETDRHQDVGPAASRRAFLAAAAGASVGAVALTADAAKRGRKSVDQPNVLLILVDDLGYGDLSCYGAEDMRTPHIDALMGRGMRFDQFYANCPVCSPTRASLLTGRYPDLVGVPGVIRTHRENNWGYLSPEAVLLPSVLKKAGYHTAIVGKWHLGLESPNTPTERGFDHCHGFLGDMMDDYYTHRRHERNYMRLNGEEIDPEGHATDLFSEWASGYIRDQAGKEDPFFLYLAYNAPHTPIQPPKEWVKRVRYREKGMRLERAELVALIEHLDDGIGRVLAALEESGQKDNTLVIFASDNGGQSSVGASNGSLNGGKQNMFEGGIRVPMCAAWPGHIPGGERSERVALTMDLFATVCEACGASYDHVVEGQSILPTLVGKKQAPEGRTLFWVRREGGRGHGGRAYYAARKGDWKLLQNTPFEPMRLYNLKEDPGEGRPVENQRAVYEALFDALRDHINRAGSVPWQAPGTE